MATCGALLREGARDGDAERSGAARHQGDAILEVHGAIAYQNSRAWSSRRPGLEAAGARPYTRPVMAELILRNVRPMGGPAADVLVRDGMIARVGSGIEPAPGATVIDGDNGILLPGLVDAHMHLDKTFWGLPWRPHEAGPDDARAYRERAAPAAGARLPADVQAERLVRQAVSRGTVHIRTHVDVDTEIGLRNFEGVMTARSRLRDAVSIQVVAFPQSGVVTRPGTAELLERAVKDGAELIGGVDPAGIDQDAKGQLDVVFGIAGRYGAGVDIHLHDPGEPGAAQIRHDRRAHPGARARRQGRGQPRLLPGHGGRAPRSGS